MVRCRSDMSGWTWFQGAESAGAGRSPPLFVYHIPRTAGTSLYSALWGATAPCGDRTVRRYDHAGQNLQALARADALVSMLPFGAHAALGRDYELALVLRDSVQRYVSWFTYLCMRTNRRPDRRAFMAYMANETMRNRMTKILSAHPLTLAVHDAQLDMARQRLSLFHHLVPFEGTSVFIAEMLQRFGLPNVLMGVLNRTVEVYRFDASDYREEIEDLNAHDLELARSIAPLLRQPQSQPLSQAPHPLTVVLSTVGDLDGEMLKGDARLAETAEVQAAMASGDLDDERGMRAFFRMLQQKGPNLLRDEKLTMAI